jgi:hypothetical protein
LLRVIATDAVNRVKELTPVDTGFLRSNWTVMLPGDVEPIAGRVPDPVAALQRARVGQRITIINPTVYARRIEYGFVGEDSLGRHYHQQGHHMVAQTLAELPSIAERATARLGR